MSVRKSCLAFVQISSVECFGTPTRTKRIAMIVDDGVGISSAGAGAGASRSWDSKCSRWRRAQWLLVVGQATRGWEQLNQPKVVSEHQATARSSGGGIPGMVQWQPASEKTSGGMAASRNSSPGGIVFQKL
ncbi:hypothetical protein NL676_025166 [Syzygium grande]|nr:hypothetical protein NL676_025166 [Syzygium grande]